MSLLFTSISSILAALFLCTCLPPTSSLIPPSLIHLPVSLVSVTVSPPPAAFALTSIANIHMPISHFSTASLCVPVSMRYPAFSWHVQLLVRPPCMPLRTNVHLYPGGEQIPYRRRVTETERRNGGEGNHDRSLNGGDH